MAAKQGDENAPVTIKKYANRRLYNTATSSYVTLDDLCKMVKDGVDFAVYDAKTGEDITRSALTQIIVEHEGKGDNMQHMMLPRYLDHSMQLFSENQERMQAHMRNALGGMTPFGSLDEMGKQNTALFEQAMKMFSPLAQTSENPPAEGDRKDDTVAELQDKLDQLQRQLNEMPGKRKD